MCACVCLRACALSTSITCVRCVDRPLHMRVRAWTRVVCSHTFSSFSLRLCPVSLRTVEFHALHRTRHSIVFLSFFLLPPGHTFLLACSCVCPCVVCRVSFTCSCVLYDLRHVALVCCECDACERSHFWACSCGVRARWWVCVCVRALLAHVCA